MRKNLVRLLALALLAGPLSLLTQADTPQIRTPQEAMQQARDGNTAAAIDGLQKLLQANPSDREVRLSLGLVYFKAKQYDNALAVFSQVTALSPDTPMAYYFKGLIYEEKGLAGRDTTTVREMKKRALGSWQDYLRYADAKKPLSGTHQCIGVSVADNIERARKHVAALKEDLGDEKN